MKIFKIATISCVVLLSVWKAETTVRMGDAEGWVQYISRVPVSELPSEAGFQDYRILSLKMFAKCFRGIVAANLDHESVNGQILEYLSNPNADNVSRVMDGLMGIVENRCGELQELGIRMPLTSEGKMYYFLNFYRASRRRYGNARLFFSMVYWFSRDVALSVQLYVQYVFARLCGNTDDYSADDSVSEMPESETAE
jgi:hypothetical protein